MASEAQKFWISYLTLKENVYQAVPRAYLKTPNAPGQRAFLRCAASFFLEIRQYSCEKMSCATQKSLAAGHIMSFQIHPRDTMRSGFFQLKEPSAADGEYTARFDAFYFADEDYTTEYEKATPNQKAVRDRLRAPFGKRVPDPAAPYDACDAPDDTGEKLLPPVRMDRV